jgi:predicted transcriptional regulator
MNTTIKIHTDTRRKLKILAALLDKSMTDVLDELVTEALEKAQSGGGVEGTKR